MSIDLEALAAEFPRDAVSWRAQSVTKDGKKAMALAYIDARDVMRRLDEVCGPENWQDSYHETAKGRVLCTIRVRFGDEWVGKSDGAGDTDVEGEKGGISDAFKRAAVKWGIGRYLYDLEAPWVPCDSYEQEWQGKKKWVWKGWQQSPWNYVKGNAPEASKANSRDVYARLSKANRECTTRAAYERLWSHAATVEAFEALPKDWRQSLSDERTDKIAEITEREAMQADDANPNAQFDRMEREAAE